MIRRFRVLLLALAVLAAAAVIFELTRPYRPDNPVDSYIDSLVGRDLFDPEDEEAPVYIELPSDAGLEGLLPVTEERLDYEDADMVLIIPSLDLTLPVRSGTSQANLRYGPGLFESSGMPGEDGANVSIVGHRSRGVFYYLDRISNGDRIQIIYDSRTYTYVFYDSQVILPTDWGVIAGQGFDCCTLITCTPIGKADKRMVVRFMLESVTSDDGAINE